MLNFRTAYIDATATLVRDGSQIARHYSHTWFPVDFVATFPFDAVVRHLSHVGHVILYCPCVVFFMYPCLQVLAFASHLSSEQLDALALLRTPRLLRLLRLLRFLERMKGANVSAHHGMQWAWL